MSAEIDQLTSQLLWARGSDGETLLDDLEANQRAKAIAQELKVLDFDLQVFPWTMGEMHPFPAYRLDDSRYNLNTVDFGEKGQFAVEGPGLSCGDLLKFGRACELKQEFLDRWPKELKDHLCDPQSHLDAVEEMLWVGRFMGVQKLRQKVRLPNGKDMDWAFTAGTQRMQIEVKHRRKEWSGVVDGAHRERAYSKWHQDFAGKFSRSGQKDILNVACLTTYFEPDEDLSKRAAELLEGDAEPDALAVWSCHCPGGNHLEIFAEPTIRQILADIFVPPCREDTQKVIRFAHPWRNTEEQRVMTLPEVLEQIRRDIFQ